MTEQKVRFRFVPLYLNDKLWKYVYADMERMHIKMSVTCFPSLVTKAARKAEPTKTMSNRFTEQIDFVRRSIPVGPNLMEERWYGVHNCFRVNPNTMQPSLVYDIPSDPEDPYHAKHRRT